MGQKVHIIRTVDKERRRSTEEFREESCTTVRDEESKCLLASSYE